MMIIIKQSSVGSSKKQKKTEKHIYQRRQQHIQS
jgi:hypothetical protein